jgi:hypothetical protein
MRLYTQPLRDQRLTGLIADAGSIWTLYRHVTAGGGTAYLGIGAADVFTTGYITGIWAQAGQNEMGLAGGQVAAGQETLYCKERIGTADKLSYSGANFEVVQEPTPAILFGCMYYRNTIKRG